MKYMIQKYGGVCSSWDWTTFNFDYDTYVFTPIRNEQDYKNFSSLQNQKIQETVKDELLQSLLDCSNQFSIHELEEFYDTDTDTNFSGFLEFIRKSKIITVEQYSLILSHSSTSRFLLNTQRDSKSWFYQLKYQLTNTH